MAPQGITHDLSLSFLPRFFQSLERTGRRTRQFEIRCCQCLPLGHDDCPLYAILKFADIAWPAMKRNRAQGIRRKHQLGLAVLNGITVQKFLCDENGVLLGQGGILLAPYGQVQNGVGAYFPSADVSNRPNLTVSFDAAAPVVGYASVVDNVSSDQIFVSAQEDTGVLATTP